MTVPDRKKIQICILQLSDGTEIKYSGPAQVDPNEDVHVVGVRITEPQDLPKGSFWGEPMSDEEDQ